MDETKEEAPRGPIPDIRDRFPELYRELQKMAAGMLSRFPGDSGTPTDVVHEVFLKLGREEQRRELLQRSRLADKPAAELKACAGAACRDVLVDRARRKDRDRSEIRESIAVGARDDFDLLALDDLLQRLAELDPVMAWVVQDRVFGKMTVSECAEHLGIPSRTIDRKWAFARAWLREELGSVESR